VTALAVAARRHEIGIRRALGATSHESERLVLEEGLAVVGVGWLGGMILTLGTSRILEGLLYRVDPTDPVALGGAALLFLVVAALACVVPARRVTRLRVVDTLSAN